MICYSEHDGRSYELTHFFHGRVSEVMIRDLATNALFVVQRDAFGRTFTLDEHERVVDPHMVQAILEKQRPTPGATA
jgi:hypothetical protein